jgi:hypothetical protein
VATVAVIVPFLRTFTSIVADRIDANLSAL